MTTRSTKTMTNLLATTLTLMLALFAGLTTTALPAFAGESAVGHEVPKVVATTNAVTHNEFAHTDEGQPRPREDVITTAAAATMTADDSQLRITGRYTDSSMVAFLNRANMNQLKSLFLEASQMIDTRHVSPTSYEERSRAAVNGLVAALNNEAFLRANNVTVNNPNIRSVQNELVQLAASQPARTSNEAVGLMEWSAELVNRRLGIRREAVALEFLNGTLDSLDRYSSFMPSVAGSSPGAELDLVRTANLNEQIVGVGVELKQHELGALILDTVDNSPAAELGLRGGDIIIAIDGQSMRGKSLNEVADKLSGRAGTNVTIDIDRNGSKFRGTMTRRQIYVGSISGTKMIDSQNKVGYVRMKQFSASTTTDLEKALMSLHQQGMKSLILDLRGNPGGLLDEAISVSDMFIPRGTIVSTKGRTASDNSVEQAKHAKTWAVPLVVLVDENSASASEILAAAIQDNGRGVVVGRKSYGKGTVQTHFPLKTVSGNLKLTTAKFYSPTGREMAGAGVTPDVLVNVQTTGYRGTDSDQDITMALQVIAQGAPAQMATLIAQGKPSQYQVQMTPVVPANPVQAFPIQTTPVRPNPVYTVPNVQQQDQLNLRAL